jgi:hypothetical protein
VLAEFRTLYRGHSTQVEAWWGSFDLAVSLFSGREADPPSQDFIELDSTDAEEITVGWWPGDPRYPRAAFYAYARPAPEVFVDADLAPGRWNETLREFVLDWDEVVSASNPHATALEFCGSAARQACVACDWDPALASSLEPNPPHTH